MDNLRDAVAGGRCIFIVGTGLSIFTTNASNSASWYGFIDDSLEYIKTTGMGDEGFLQSTSGVLEYAKSSNDTNVLISAAEMVRQKIAEQGEVALENWLRETVGSLKNQNNSWIESLNNSGCPILTTNYDTLIENGSGRESASWRNPAEIQKILMNNSTKIGHLHGTWDDPSSVILGQTDYQTLLATHAAQELQRAASSLKQLIYVGVGSGLVDPNFSRLIKWHRATFRSSIPHFRLCTESDLSRLREEHRADHIVPIAYGKSYDDLPSFIDGLRPQSGTDVLLSDAGLIQSPVQLAQEMLVEQVREQSIVCENVPDRESRSLEQLIIPPVLYPVAPDRVNAASQINSEVKIVRSDSREVGQYNGITVLVAEENSGLTTTLQWLLNEAATTSGLPPILANFGKFRRGGRPLLTTIRSEARRLNIQSNNQEPAGKFVVAVDNVSPYAGRICDQMIDDLLRANPRQVFLGCRREHEPELLEKLKSAGITPEVRYLGRFNRKDVVSLVSLATSVHPERVASNVISILNQQHLPRNPFVISLLVSILLAGNSIAANSSHTLLLDQYLSQLLGRGNVYEDARWSVDVGLREAVLCDIAILFVERRLGSLPGSEITARIETYFAERDIPESAVIFSHTSGRNGSFEAMGI